MKLTAIGSLIYQMEIKQGIAISKKIIFKNQTDLLNELRELEKNFEKKEEFLNFISENVILSCCSKLEIEK